MKTKHAQTTVFTLVGLVTAALLNGCGTTPAYKQADKTGAGIAEFREEIVSGKHAVDATMKSLGNIATTATSDPRKAFEQYSKDVAKLDSIAAKVRKRSQNMKDQGQAYFKQWEQELASLNNPDIRKLAEERKDKLQKTFASISKYTEPLKAQFDPGMADLKDLQAFLSTDLTITGVDAAKDIFAKATREGAEVQKAMDALVAELNTLAATITPSKLEKAKSN